jgi:hypothetical protein
MAYITRVKEDEKARILSSSTASHDFLDQVFLRDPERDRKQRYGHFKPLALGFTLLKNGLLRSVVLLSQEEPPRVPFHDKLQLVRFILDQLWWPVLKDISIQELARFYESLVFSKAFPGDSVRAGRFIQGSCALSQTHEAG